MFEEEKAQPENQKIDRGWSWSTWPHEQALHHNRVAGYSTTSINFKTASQEELLGRSSEKRRP